MWYYEVDIYSPTATHPDISKVDSKTGGIYLNNNEDRSCSIRQKLEYRLETGKKYTLTISYNCNGIDKIDSFSVIGGTSSEFTLLPYVTIEYYDNGTSLGGPYQWIKLTSAIEITVHFIKLEDGDMYTGYIPRRYDEEFRICQRYYYILPYGQYICGSDSGGTIYIHDPWIINNMAGTERVIINGITTSCGLKYDGNNSTGTIKQIDYVFNSVRIIFNEVTPLSTTVYFYYNTTSNYIGVRATGWDTL